jgi:SH3-like domain-containing protein
MQEELPAGGGKLLIPVFGAPSTGMLLAVTERRGEWLRVIVDDAGREGWVRRERAWDYSPWEEYLKGRSARLLPGLRKNCYQLLAAPVDSAGVIAVLAPQTEEFRFIGLQGEWALVLVGQSVTGWLRWCDRDRRFLVTVSPSLPTQKH